MAKEDEEEKSRINMNVCKISSQDSWIWVAGKKSNQWILCLGESDKLWKKSHMKRAGECFLLAHCCISSRVTPFPNLQLDWLCHPFGFFTKIWATMEEGCYEENPGESCWDNGHKYTWETVFHQKHFEYPGTNFG